MSEDVTMKSLNYRKESRRDWSRLKPINEKGNAFLSDEQLKLGAILRIADAVEKMTDNFQHLSYQRDMYKTRYERERTLNAKLKQQVKELKKQLKS